jgi:hypothetical protein
MLKARYRLFTLGLLNLFTENSSANEGKMVKYRAICDTLEEIKQAEVIDGKS